MTASPQIVDAWSAIQTDIEKARRDLLNAQEASAAAYRAGKPLTGTVAAAATRLAELEGCRAGLERLDILDEYRAYGTEITLAEAEIAQLEAEREKIEGKPVVSGHVSYGGERGTAATVRAQLSNAYLPTSRLAMARKKQDALRLANPTIFVRKAVLNRAYSRNFEEFVLSCTSETPGSLVRPTDVSRESMRHEPAR